MARAPSVRPGSSDRQTSPEPSRCASEPPSSAAGGAATTAMPLNRISQSPSTTERRRGNGMSTRRSTAATPRGRAWTIRASCRPRAIRTTPRPAGSALVARRRRRRPAATAGLGGRPRCPRGGPGHQPRVVAPRARTARRGSTPRRPVVLDQERRRRRHLVWAGEPPAAAPTVLPPRSPRRPDEPGVGWQPGDGVVEVVDRPRPTSRAHPPPSPAPRARGAPASSGAASSGRRRRPVRGKLSPSQTSRLNVPRASCRPPPVASRPSFSASVAAAASGSSTASTTWSIPASIGQWAAPACRCSRRGGRSASPPRRPGRSPRAH